MPTIISHAVAAAALVTAFPPQIVSRRLAWVGAACSMLPDADVVGLHFGIPYGSLLGHRGFTHSLLFAALMACAVHWAVCWQWAVRSHRGWVWLYLFLATASHGALDACTNGGLGVAFLSPFDGARHFSAFTPIAVSPIGARFFSARGFAVLRSEFLWVWLPSLTFAATATAAWRVLGRTSDTASAPCSPANSAHR